MSGLFSRFLPSDGKKAGDFFLDVGLTASVMVNIDNNNVFFSLSNSAVWVFQQFRVHQTGPVVEVSFITEGKRSGVPPSCRASVPANGC